jgi:hypothetical protein
MALVRMMKDIPDTFGELTLKLLSMVSKGYFRVDLVADCYFANSIKDAERAKRGIVSKITIKSPQSKVRRDFNKFLSSGENKTRMIELIVQTIKEKGVHCLNILKTTNLILSRENECILLTLADCCEYPSLLSNHEEADPKVRTIQFLSYNNCRRMVQWLKRLLNVHGVPSSIPAGV